MSKINSEPIPFNPNQIEPPITDPHTIGCISAATRIQEIVPAAVNEIIKNNAAKVALNQLKESQK